MRVARHQLRPSKRADSVGARPVVRAPPAPTASVLDVGADALGPRGIEALLTAAALVRKSEGPEGHEPLVGPHQAGQVRVVWARASAEVRRELTALLSSLVGPGAAVARALLLRAVAVRARSLIDEARVPSALEVLRRFAARLANTSADQLRRRATVLDLDSRHNTSAFDPQQLWATRGTVVDVRRVDTHADNDGLFQRFTGACGAATLQMLLAEADPVMAFALHDVGLTSDATDDAIADFQRAVLDEYGGGKALGRTESYLRSRIHNAFGRMVRDGELKRAACVALRDALAGAAPERGLAALALERVRARWGFPSDEEVARLCRVALPTADQGISVAALTTLVNERHGACIGVRYAAREFARGHAWRHVDAVAAALRQGIDVPFGCSEPPHWMLLTAVKGRRPHRHLLVSDPDGGRTTWVHERSLVRGTFLDEQLHLARPGDRPYVDCFLVPERT